MKKVWAWAPIACFCLTIGFAQDFDAGLKAYQDHDYAAALKQWRPLAEHGHPAAQFNLGLLYYDGTGVPQDFREAANWFQQSAEQGYAKAQLNLGAMYGVGKGLKRDYVLAYKWLSLCAASGSEKCAAQRDLVAEKLSASKLAKAQQMARDFKPKTPEGQ